LASVSALASPLLFVAGQYGEKIFTCQQKLLRNCYNLTECYTWAMKIISAAEAAKRLNVTPTRVRAMISSGRLKATKVGNMWVLDPKDLEAVKNRKVGRPRKARKTSKR
jgi:excisionase family DNA binding protein